MRSYPLAQLRSFDAGGYFAPEFAGTSIPTLQDVFEALGTRLLMNVEIKPFVTEPEAPAKVVQLIRAHGLTQRVIVSSFNPLILRRVRRIAPELALGFLHERKTPYPIRFETVVRALIGRYQARHPHFSDVTPRYMDWARRRGYRVNTWTVNEPEDIRRMLELGVEMIISDQPDVVRDVMQGTHIAKVTQ
jgi:glycerophosphoryl diester phosphodiesterase